MSSTKESVAGKKLGRSFYLRPTLEVAPDLIGKTIVFKRRNRLLAADIVEVEAYIGEDDPACHAAAGPTARNGIMYDTGGHAYIYFIYGMYHCFNIVTEKKGFPAAVLVRAVEPVAGKDIMAAAAPPTDKKLTDGPGKFCRAFGLTRRHNGINLTGTNLFLVDRGKDRPRIHRTSRIGIRRGRDKTWRFYDADSAFVTRPTSQKRISKS